MRKSVFSFLSFKGFPNDLEINIPKLIMKRRALTTWNLPASIEDVSGANKIPQSLLDKSQLIKDKGGISRIDAMMAELPSLLQRNTEILNETKRQLVEEEKSDTDLRTQMREKWTRTPSRQLTEYLHSEIKQYENIMENAIKANKVIEEKYRKHRDGIQLLSRPVNEISTSLPAATPVAALKDAHVIKDLRRLMDEVEGLKSVREVLESEMKNMDSDAITAKLISALQTSQGLGEHTIIQEEVDALVNPIRKQVKENIQEQEKLLGYIEKANSEFNTEKVHNETSKMREEMLRNLSSASDSFNELYNHLEEGNKVMSCVCQNHGFESQKLIKFFYFFPLKFYNDLTPILIKFQSKVNDFVFARKTEKEDLMKDIQTNLTRPSSAGGSSGSAKPERPPPPVPSYSTDGSSGSGGYPSSGAPPYPNPYYPMMPNAYNPYSSYNLPGQPNNPFNPYPTQK
jgi:programmed cell death 6-interacting protein